MTAGSATGRSTRCQRRVDPDETEASAIGLAALLAALAPAPPTGPAAPAARRTRRAWPGSGPRRGSRRSTWPGSTIRRTGSTRRRSIAGRGGCSKPSARRPSTRPGHVAACEAHLERIKKLEAKIRRIRKIGFGDSLDVLEVDYYRKEADFWLAQARAAR